MAEYRTEPQHADTCDKRYAWTIPFTSKNLLGVVMALEIECSEHEVHFWFPPRAAIVALVEHHLRSE